MIRAMEPMVFSRKGVQYALQTVYGETIRLTAKLARFNAPAFMVIGGRLPNATEPEGVIYIKQIRPNGTTEDCAVVSPSAYGLKWKELNHVTA